MSNPTPTVSVLTTEAIDKLFLELSQFTLAKTAKEIALESSLELAQRERDIARTADSLTARQLMEAQATIRQLMEAQATIQQLVEAQATTARPAMGSDDELDRVTGIPRPTLAVQRDSNSIWLRFKTSDGMDASITLTTIMERCDPHGVTYKALAAWGNAVRAMPTALKFEIGARDDITIKTGRRTAMLMLEVPAREDWLAELKAAYEEGKQHG